MTLTEQVKILDDKIKANKAQHDLDGQAAKISALSSGELEKYEYLTGEDLGYKPDIIQKARKSKKDDKLKLKSLRYLINKENKKQVKHFDMLFNLEENKIDYNDLYYRSGNRSKDSSNLEQFGTMPELFQKTKFEKIALEDVEPILIRLRHELNSLQNTTTRKQTYADKNAEIL